MEQEFLNFVAEIMGKESDEISMETTYGEEPAWDSVVMLTLVMELEEKYFLLLLTKQFLLTIRGESLDKIRQLKDLYRIVSGSKD